MSAVVPILRTLSIAAFAVCAFAQFILYWQIAAEHKPGRSKASFLLTKIPRRDDLTPRGQQLSIWWWRTTLAAIACVIGLMALRR